MRQTMICFRWLLGLYVFAQTLHSATYVLFLQHHGLNLFEVNLVNFCFFTTLFAFEIPTGAFADVFGRKPSFLMACVLWAVGLALYGYSTTLGWFIAAELILAIGATFFSGAFEAWYVDSIKYHGQESDLQTLLSYKEEMQRWVSIAGMIFGAVVAHFYLPLPWYLGSVTMVIAFFVALRMMREEYLQAPASTERVGLKQIRQTIRIGMDYGWKNPAVRFLVFTGTIHFFAMQPANMYWAPHFSTFTDSIIVIGIIRVMMQLGIILGARYSTRFADKFSDYRKAILVAQIFVAITLSLSGLPWLAASLGLFLTHEVGRGVLAPIKSRYMHESIPSTVRATIISFESLFNHLGGAVGLLLAGVTAKYLGVQASWVIFGLILLIASAWHYRRIANEKK